MPLAKYCWRLSVNDDCSLRLKESFSSFFFFFWKSQDIADHLVVFNPPLLPTTLMILFAEFLYATLFLKVSR